MSDFQPGMTAPPFHPWCRSCTAPFFDDEFSQDGYRASRNAEGKTVYEVPANMTYPEWKKAFVDVDKSDGSGIIKERAMANGMRQSRNRILNETEIEYLKEDARSLGIDLNILQFNVGQRTGFNDDLEMIFIKGDVLPDLESSVTRDKMSQKAVLAHEYYGHYKNHPSEYEIGDWRDEFRASYDAAQNAPNLTDEDRAYLMLDAYDRAKEAGEFLEYDEKARRIIYGY